MQNRLVPIVSATPISQNKNLEIEMLKNLVRSFVIARTASAADETIRNMSAQQLQDIGIDRRAHVQELIARLQDDYALKDAEGRSVITSAVPLSIKLQSA